MGIPRCFVHLLILAERVGGALAHLRIASTSTIQREMIVRQVLREGSSRVLRDEDFGKMPVSCGRLWGWILDTE